MSKLYGIWGCDCIYGGLHGMIGREVIEADSDEAALTTARELAVETIESYGQIIEDLETSTKEICEADGIEPYSDKYWEIYEEEFRGDLEYGAFEIDLKKTPSLEIWVLDEMYYEDPEDFEEEYKKRNV